MSQMMRFRIAFRWGESDGRRERVAQRKALLQRHGRGRAARRVRVLHPLKERDISRDDLL